MEKEYEVVISGIGGHFPKSTKAEAFFKSLLDHEDLAEDARWSELYPHDGCSTTGKIPEMERFDFPFFSVHRNQLKYMDPMQCILMENSIEAVIDAGVNPIEIRGRKIGVYSGGWYSEGDTLISKSYTNSYIIVGQARSMMAHRVSYALHTTGPSIFVDSNFNTGFQALQLASNAIKKGQIEAAIIGCGNAVCNPSISWVFKSIGRISDDGKTRSFDEDANGHLRSEGAIAMFLQRAEDARRNYGTVVHTDVEYNGDRETPLFEMCPDGMASFLERFYQKCDVDPAAVEYLEGHGAAIKSIDEAEMAAVEKVFCKNRKGPLLVGSVKSNAGHAEGASTLMALVKVLLSMECGTIPANLHFKTPNKNIQGFHNGNLQVVSENTKWEGNLAAVNCCSLFGSYGHVLIKSTTGKKKERTLDVPLLTVFSTRTEGGIELISNLIKSYPPDLEYSRLTHSVFSSDIHDHIYRGFVLKGDTVKSETEHFSGLKAPVWFVYPGMGSQWPGMGNDLMKLPVFAESIERTHNVLATVGMDLKNIITSSDPSVFDVNTNCFVGIGAIQIALTRVLQSIGIVPDGLIGHSFGESGCAFADGCLTDEEMILGLYYRGKASSEVKLINGTMAAVGLSGRSIKCLIPPTIDVACYNGPDGCTISGPTEDIEKFIAELKSKNVFAKAVQTSNIAYHSRYIKPIENVCYNYLKKIIPRKERSPKWITTSFPTDQHNCELAKYSSPEYHTNNLMSSVYFEDGLKAIPKNAIVIEIAPRGFLQAILKRSLPDTCTTIPLTNSGKENVLEHLIAALGRLYIRGVPMDLSAIYPKVDYPVSRGTRSLGPIVQWDHGDEHGQGLSMVLLNGAIDDKEFSVSLSSKEYRDQGGNVYKKKVYLSPSIYLEILSDEYKRMAKIEHLDAIVFENVRVCKAVGIFENDIVNFKFKIQHGMGNFEVNSNDEVIVTGKLYCPEKLEMMKNEEVDCRHEMSSSDFYNELKKFGYEYSGTFKAVNKYMLGTSGFSSIVRYEGRWRQLLDMCMQMHLMSSDQLDKSLPKYFRRITIDFKGIPMVAEEIKMSHSNSTNTTSTAGFEVRCMESIESVEEREMFIEEERFMKFHREDIKTLKNGTNLIRQILSDVCEGSVIEIQTFRDAHLNDLITELSKSLEDYSIKFEVTTDICQDADTVKVLIADDNHLNEAIEKLKTNNNFLLLKLYGHSETPLTANPGVLVSFEFENYHYYLIRQIPKLLPNVVNVKSSKISRGRLTDQSQWLAELKSVLRRHEMQYKKERIFVVSRTVPEGGIRKFMKTVTDTLEFNQVRFIFALDGSAPECTPGAAFYYDTFRKDLPLAVLRAGVWGTHVFENENVCLTKSELRHQKYMKALESPMMPNIQLQYLGILSKDLGTPLLDLGLVDYIGIDSQGNKVMGIAQIDERSLQIIPDPHFQWKLPACFNEKDAAIIPYAYTTAYYILTEVLNLYESDRIFINGGHTGIGLALLAICTSMNLTVFTSVETERQRRILDKYLFRKSQVVMQCDSKNYAGVINTSTNGFGVDTVINCVQTDIQDIRPCLSNISRLLLLGISEDLRYETIGMNFFLFSSMLSVDVANILDRPTDVKLRLKDLVQAAIDNRITCGIPSKEFDSSDLDKIPGYVNSRSTIGGTILKVNQSINKTSGKTHPKSYVIFGDLNMMYQLVEWCCQQNTKQIVLVPDRPYLNHFSHNKILQLSSSTKTNIAFETVNLDFAKEVSDFLKTVAVSRAIDAVFVLPGRNGSTHFEDLCKIDMALFSVSTVTHLVCFLGESEKAYVRLYGGPVCNVRWDSKKCYWEAIKALDVTCWEERQGILLKNSQKINVVEVWGDMLTLCPDSAKTLEEMGRPLSSEGSYLIQLPSLCPPKSKNLPPLFVVPGISGHHCPHLQTLVRQLMYTVHVVCLDRLDFEQNTMENVAKEIQKVSKYHEINILAVSWGGILAAHIAKTLESFGQQFSMFFIDSDPFKMKRFIDNGPENFEVHLLKKIFNFNTDEKDTSSLDWKTMLKQITETKEHSAVNYDYMVTAINRLKERKHFATMYPVAAELSGVKTYLMERTGIDENHLRKIIKHFGTVILKEVTTTQSKLMFDKEVLLYVNENVAY